MGSISRKGHAPNPIVRHDTLMHPVRPHLVQVPAFCPGDDVVHARLDQCFFQLLFGREVLTRVDGDPPTPGHLQETEIAAMLPAIGDIR